MSSSVSSNLYHMCGYVGLGRGGAIGLWETMQLILSTGSEWREVRNLALKATTLSMGFALAFENHACETLWTAYYCIILYTFLLCWVKINNVKVLRHLHLFLSLLEWLVTVINQKPYRLVQIGIVSAKNRINNFPPREPSSAALNVLCMNAVCVLQAAVAWSVQMCLLYISCATLCIIWYESLSWCKLKTGPVYNNNIWISFLFLGAIPKQGILFTVPFFLSIQLFIIVYAGIKRKKWSCLILLCARCNSLLFYIYILIHTILSLILCV